MICDPDASVWPSAFLQLVCVGFGAGLSWLITTQTQKRHSLAEVRRGEFESVIAEISKVTMASSGTVNMDTVQNLATNIQTVIYGRIFVSDEIRKLQSYQEWFKAYKNLENVHDTLIKEK